MKNKLYKSKDIKDLDALKVYENNYDYLPKELENYFDGEVSILIVDKDYRGKNIGQKLLIELFKLCKENAIHTALDTSGILFDSNNKKFEELIKYVDLVLLDIKHIDNEKHIELTTKSNKNALEFAKFLSNNNVPVWIRHVLVPTINTQEEYLIETRKFIDTLTNVKKVEILPYHTLGISKYEMLNIPYLLKGINPPSKEEIELAKSILIKE